MIILQALASLALRFALAIPFWRSGLVRWEAPFELTEATKQLYQYVYELRPCDVFSCPAFALPEKTYPLPYPEILAYAGSAAEIVLPAALVLGFATRLSALGLLGMTAVIFLVNPASWPNEQLPWAAMALGLIAYGPGLFSVDRLIWSSFRR